MNAAILSVSGSPEELDKLIQSFEYENQQIVKFIEKENQLIEALEREVTQKKEAVNHLQESTSQLDEETKRAHKQFIQNRDNCESLRKTASLYLDHEVAVMKKLNSIVVTGEQERTDRKKVLEHYNNIWLDYKSKYESFPLAQTLQQKKKQVEASTEKLVEVQTKVQKLKNEIINVRGADVDIYDMKKFLVAVAKLKLDSGRKQADIGKKVKEKAKLGTLLKEAEKRKLEAEQEQERKALEIQKQQEMLSSGPEIRCYIDTNTTNEQRDVTNSEDRGSAEGNRSVQLRKGEISTQVTSCTQGNNSFTETSTLAHLYDGDSSPCEPPTLRQQGYSQIPPQTPQKVAQCTESTCGNVQQNQGSIATGNQPISLHQPQHSSFLIQAPIFSPRIAPTAGLGRGTPHRRPLPEIAIPRHTNFSQSSLLQKAPEQPMFKHPSSLDPTRIRLSPPQPPQNSSPLNWVPSPRPLTTRADSYSNAERTGNNMRDSQVPSPVLPPQTTLQTEKAVANDHQEMRSVSGRGEATPVTSSVPQTPVRENKTSSAEPKTPEHQEVFNSQPSTPVQPGLVNSDKSPFNMEKHLETVRLLTNSPATPTYSTRPMFGPVTATSDKVSTAEENQSRLDGNPFIQSFFPDGRGDGNPFQPNFTASGLEPSGKSLFGGTDCPANFNDGSSMAFDFSSADMSHSSTSPSMFSLFGASGQGPNSPREDNSAFSFNFGSSGMSSPPVGTGSSGFSLF